MVPHEAKAGPSFREEDRSAQERII